MKTELELKPNAIH